MPLCRFRRQYEQPSQFERGRIIGMMKAGWSARRVARRLGRSDCIVRRCWDQWIREISFARRLGSGRPRQTSHREDHHIVRNARVQPTASSTAIWAQVATSLGAPVSSRTIRRRLAKRHLGSRRLLRVLPLTPTLPHRRLRLEWCRARGNWTAVEWNQVVFSDESRFNLSSDILQPHVLPLMQRLPGAIFQQDNARPLTARLSPHCYNASLACPFPRFVSHRAYLGSFGMASWASHEFERTRGKVTANMERNVSRHPTELVCLNARSITSCIRGRGGPTRY
ncbi:transposable element Tcb2 transposase [Trichonephila clavipes]|nr:transposable element Tcb2 transposase [Trichonephila clavipes]